MTKRLLLVLSLGLLGADADCNGSEDPPSMRLILEGGPSTRSGLLSTPSYWQDRRTGLCFASSYSGYWAESVVLVPCGVVEGARAKIEAQQ